jgi:hypothetical protein
VAETLSLSHSMSHARASSGLTFSGALSLLAVAAVLVVVSLPRLRGLALAENEAEARATTQLFAQALRSEAGADGRLPSWRELLRRPELAGVLADGELVAQGRLLRRHGYLFELTRLAPSLSVPSAPCALLAGARGGLCSMLAVHAWPWSHGATGEAAFLATAGGAELVHPNEEPRWQGLEAAGRDLGTLQGWSATPR